MSNRAVLWITCLAALMLVGCGSTPLYHAPVEDRNVAGSGGSVAVSASPVKLPPGAENAGKPGYYMVKPSDTLIRIGLETGQSHKDIARWNALDNPNKIEVGQVLRVIPPTGDVPAPAAVGAVAVATGAHTKPVSTGTVTTTAIATPVLSSGSTAAAASAPAKPVAAAAAASAAAPAKPVAAASHSGEDELGWIWPGKGNVIAEFDEVKNKGVDISGSAGDPVLAAADGKVVYAGAGLRGYGNLVILKHNNTYLSAYAHNQSLLVKEDQSVKKGQKIAEMGNSDADRVKLHFEVRRQGKPVDPMKYLPAK